MSTVVDHLKKVRLAMQSAHRSVNFEFIVGMASDGLCPFEYELLHKAVGDRLHLHIPAEKIGQTLAHLQRPLGEALHPRDPRENENIDLDITIAAIEAPEPREVVRAMAQAAEEHGCGGDCGCGCGNH